MDNFCGSLVFSLISLYVMDKDSSATFARLSTVAPVFIYLFFFKGVRPSILEWRSHLDSNNVVFCFENFDFYIEKQFDPKEAIRTKIL